jgi:outer membrane protein assembly factor BamB
VRRAIALLGLLALAAGCDKQKNVDPPAELVDFAPRLIVERVWSVSTGGGDETLRLALTPVVQADTVYAAGHKGDVMALAADSGRVKWRTHLKTSLGAGPSVGGGLVVVGSLKGEAIALDAETGVQRWRTSLGGEVLAPAAVGAARVLVRTVDGRLQGLAAADGRVAWSYEQPVPRLSLRGSAAPVISGDMALCAFDNGKVAALGLDGGDLLWSAAVAAPHGRTELERLVDIDSAVIVSGEDVYAVGYQGRVAMLARSSGQVWWSRELSSHRGLATDGSLLFITAADSVVVALGRRDGSDAWRQDAMLRRRLTGAAVDGDAIVVADFEGRLHWLDRQSGELLARANAGSDRISNAPVAANGLVLVQTDAGAVHAFRTRARAAG